MYSMHFKEKYNKNTCYTRSFSLFNSFLFISRQFMHRNGYPSWIDYNILVTYSHEKGHMTRNAQLNQFERTIGRYLLLMIYDHKSSPIAKFGHHRNSSED